MNIADILQIHRASRPDHPAVECGDSVITYGALAARVDDCAARMRGRGIRAGDMIAINLPDGADYIVVLYALAKLGAVAFPLSGASPPMEQKQLLEQVGAKLLLIPAHGISAAKSAPALMVTEICTGGDGNAAAAGERVVTDGFDGNSPLIVISSSGTSAAAKLLLLTHGQMYWRITTRERFIGFLPEDRYLSLIRLSFNLGRIRCMRAIQCGATVLFPAPRRGEGVLEILRSTRTTITNMMPTQVQKVFGRIQTNAPLMNDLRLVIGSSPTSAEDRLRIRRKVTPHLYEVYATTEVGPIAVAAPEDQDRQPQSVGRLVNDIEVEVVDGEGRALPPGEIGQIRFRAPALPTEYIRNPQASANAFRNGWFYPGDLAAISADGYLFFKGRDDDVINNEGAKFYPLEVESVLLSHPEVLEAAVLGVSHATVGQAAAACIVTRSEVSEKALRDFCRERIAAFKVPFAIFFLDSLPKSPAGKVRKQELLQMVMKRLSARRKKRKR